MCGKSQAPQQQSHGCLRFATHISPLIIFSIVDTFFKCCYPFRTVLRFIVLHTHSTLQDYIGIMTITRPVWTGFKIAERHKLLMHNNTRLHIAYKKGNKYSECLSLDFGQFSFVPFPNSSDFKQCLKTEQKYLYFGHFSV